MKIKHLFAGVLALVSFASCDVAQQVGSAYNMVNCNYSYNSISNLSLAGMDFSKGINLVNGAQAAAALSGNTSSLPLQFTLNLNVNNPNTTAAALNGMHYILSIDNVEFTTGSLSQSLNIGAGQTQVLPLTIGVDLAKLMSGDSKDAVTNIAKNFLGIGGRKSNVSLQLRPTFMVGNYPVTSPVYIPLSFSFGGNS